MLALVELCKFMCTSWILGCHWGSAEVHWLPSLHVPGPYDIIKILNRHSITSKDSSTGTILQIADNTLSPASNFVLFMFKLNTKNENNIKDILTDAIIVLELNRSEFLCDGFWERGIFLFLFVSHLPVLEEQGFEDEFCFEVYAWH